METTLTIIVVTVLITVGVISLGLGIWAIARVSRKVLNLEGLRESHEKQFESIYREFDIVRNKHDNDIKELNQSLHTRIDGVINENERNLDKRFDKVYRKINEVSNKDTQLVNIITEDEK